eukprot:1126766-Pleurochrysis_carterae.AAC.1
MLHATYSNRPRPERAEDLHMKFARLYGSYVHMRIPRYVNGCNFCDFCVQELAPRENEAP